MRKAILILNFLGRSLLGLLILLSFYGSAWSQELKTTTNKLSGSTTLETNMLWIDEMRIEHGDIIGLSMDFKSTKSKDEKVNTAIVFLSTASKLRYKNAPNLVVIVDGHRRTFAPDARRYKRSRISPTKEEDTIVIPISSDELTWLTEAKSVDCQFGSTTFRLSDYQQRIVRNFAAQVKR